jgi:2-methylisocitrate lyase-like PEP mutase family enzyme
MDATARRAAFRALHDDGCFVMPNPWDRGSARALAALGFEAVATTSAGMAFSRGLPDSPDVLDVEPVLDHVADIVDSVDLPVNADFQAGYADDLDGLADNVVRCVGTGVAGLSIEDVAGWPGASLLELPTAVERVRVAREAIDSTGDDVLLTARAECFLYDHADPLGEAVRRLTAFAEAGADALFAPGIRSADDIRTLVEAVRPVPVNVLVSGNTGITIAELEDLGVRRVSVGSALARTAWGGFLAAATELAERGTFGAFEVAAPFSRMNDLFAG